VRVVGARLHRLEALERRHGVPEQQPEKPRSGERERERESGKKRRGRARNSAGRRWAHSRILEMSSPSIFGGPGGMRGGSRFALAELKRGGGVRREEAGKEAVALASGRRDRSEWWRFCRRRVGRRPTPGWWGPSSI
jgi:hypothetical protein